MEIYLSDLDYIFFSFSQHINLGILRACILQAFLRRNNSRGGLVHRSEFFEFQLCVFECLYLENGFHDLWIFPLIVFLFCMVRNFMHENLNHLTDLILSNWIFPNRCSLLIRLRIHLCGGQTRGSAVVTCEISLSHPPTPGGLL